MTAVTLETRTEKVTCLVRIKSTSLVTIETRVVKTPKKRYLTTSDLRNFSRKDYKLLIHSPLK